MLKSFYRYIKGLIRIATPENDDLKLKLHEQSKYVNYEPRGQKLRIRNLHKKGNWVTLDLGSVCMVTDVIINWDISSYNLAVEIDTWSEVGESPSRLLYEQVHIQSGAKPTEETPKINQRHLSRPCRYVKIAVSAVTTAYGSLMVDISLYGIHDYVSPAVPVPIYIQKLSMQLENTKKKLQEDTNNFEAKRRELTTALEEVGTNDSDYSNNKSQITTLYNDCMNYKDSYNRMKRKLRRLNEIMREIDPTIPKEGNFDPCELDRYTV